MLGAGVSGLTAARVLHDRGADVVVFEKNSTVGGLARTRITDGYVYDPHGGHIFNSKNEDVKKWVFSILPEDKWKHTVRNAKIFFDGEYISYPFELSLCELPTDVAIDCACDFIQAEQGPEPDNFKDWLIWHFGKGIADYYMIPYNTKIWAYPLEDMEVHWMQGKMPLPEKKEILKSLVLKDSTERKMVHSTFYYPLIGGIQTMVDAIAEPLNIKCNSAVEKCIKGEGGWYINGEGPFDHIISTIPLPELNNAMELPKEISDCIKDLKYNSLSTFLFSCPPTDITWLYIPNSKYRSHRVGYQSALTPYATPFGGSGALEIIGPQFGFDDNIIHKAIPKELHAEKLIDYEFTKYAYVIHDQNYRKNVTAIRSYFESVNGFSLLGRWGLWNYNNMDLCMLDAMKLASKIMGE